MHFLGMCILCVLEDTFLLGMAHILETQGKDAPSREATVNVALHPF